jgi:hypothetical protein
MEEHVPATARKCRSRRKPPRFRFVVHTLGIDEALWDVDLHADGVAMLTGGRAFNSKRAAKGYARTWARLLGIMDKSEIVEAGSDGKG